MNTKKCPVCNKIFTARNGNAIYCSNTCRMRFVRRNLRLVPIEDSRSMKIRTKFSQLLQQPLESLCDNHHKLLKDILVKLDQIIASQSDIPQQQEQYLVPSQACTLLSINRSTFDRFVHEGIFKVYRLGKGKVYVKRSEINQLFVSQ